jgi:DNA invertase Pin-like site-specific DNA recombinase
MLGIYCRISVAKDDGKDRSINDQEQLGIELADKLNVSYKVYKDEGLSGTLPIDERPAFSSLIDDVYSGLITKVYVLDQSRLERSPEVRFAVNKVFKDNNIELYTDSGLVHNDIESEFAGDLMSVINNFYTKITSKKIKSVLKRNAQEGRRFAILPYGYSADNDNMLIVNEVESLVIKRIFELSLDGVGTNKIAELLNADKVPTRYNGMSGTISTKDKYDQRITTREKSSVQWSGNSIRGILNNTIYKGLRKWGKEYYSAPAIFEDNYWNKVNDNLKNNRNNSGKVVDHLYLLKGLIRCGKCGRNYYGRTRVSKKDNYYMCSSKRIKHENCGNRSINIDVLDKLIWTMFKGEDKFAVLIQEYFKNNSSDEIKLELKSKISSLEKNIKQLEKDKERLLDLILLGAIESGDVKSRMDKIRSEKLDLEKQLYNLEEQLLSIDGFNFQLDSILKELKLPYNVAFEDKKVLLKKYLKNIAIYFDNIDTYFIEIEFNLLGMDSVVYVVRNNYKIAHTTIYDGVKNILFNFIILDENLELTLKDNSEIDIAINMNSGAYFDELKKDCNIIT